MDDQGEMADETLAQEPEERFGKRDRLARMLRVVSVLLHPFMPGSAERLLAALGREDLSLDGAVLGAAEGGARIGELGQLFPRVEAEAPAA